MKKHLLLLIMMFLPMFASAEAVEIDGIYYNIVSKAKEAEVTSNPSGYAGEIVIPEIVIYDNAEYTVTSIGESAFKKCSNLIEVTIPNSVTSIGDYAFLECEELNSVTIGNGVTTIGIRAFGYCPNLSSITIPNSVTIISSYVFQKCSGLTSIIIPSSVTSIGSRAFAECTGLTSIDIPNSVTSIGDAVFADCGNLSSVKIGNGVSSIGEGCFYNCSSLTSITIGNSVNRIKKNAFYGCIALSTITIPNNVTSIGDECFSGCRGLTSFFLGTGVTTIGNSAFYGCIALSTITIPNNVTSIGNECFSGCNELISVTIGSGIQNVKKKAFANCPNLNDVYCYADNLPTTSNDAFDGSLIEYATLHVPVPSIDIYRTASPWSDFKNIMGIDGIPETPKCATPTISYKNGKLIFNSETDGVEFMSEISDTDIKKSYDAEIQLSATYTITVYATKFGYENSDVATATLCWIDQKPATEGITDGIANIPAKALLIKNNGGQLTVEGAVDGEAISVYTVNGMQSGSAISQNGAARIDTNLQAGSIAIVKIGDKSIKVVIK